MSHEVVTTTRGARAMRDTAVGEVMHPGAGPLVEAQQLYVQQSRLAERLQIGQTTLFDVGLGAGSNAIAAWRVAETVRAHRLELVSFERDIGALRLALDPAHAADFGLTNSAGVAARALLEHGVHDSAYAHWRLVDG